MADSLYIASLEQGSGKLVVTIGVMEVLSRRVDRIGFFRPVTPRTPEADNDIRLIKERYNISLDVEQMGGLPYEEARRLMANGKERRLYRDIIAKYNEAKALCDFVLCEGPDISTLSEAFDFDISIRIARELGTPALYVSNGRGGTPDQLLEKIRVAEKTFLHHQCPLLAVFVNRVDPELLPSAEKKLRKITKGLYHVDLLPETHGLNLPTLDEIMSALQADHFSGPKDCMQRDVNDIKVAAMSSSNFLTHLEQDDLIITPGDRPDVILATLGAIASKNYPSPVGMLLTGGLEPSASMVTLLEGLDDISLPIFTVPNDTYRTAMRAGKVKGILRPQNEKKIALALGMFEANVNTRLLEEQVADMVSTTISPLMFEYSLFQRARTDRKHIVLPEGDDDRVLKAAEILRLRDVVDLTILGEEKSIRRRANALGLLLENIAIIDPRTSPLRQEFAQTFFELRQHKGITRGVAHDIMSDVSYFGTMMVYRDMVDGMVSGAAHTTQHTIRPAFQFIRTPPEVVVVSSVFFMCLETKVLVYGDCAVNPNPNSEELAEIAISSAATASMFGIEPIVAMLSYSSGASGKGADVEQVRKAVEIARQRRPDLKIDGPIQYDAAIDASVASKKMPQSEVAGKATVFIFPDLNTGNNTYKAVQRSSGAVAIGPVLQGLNKPVNDLSRGCLVPDIVNTVAITAIQAQAL